MTEKTKPVWVSPSTRHLLLKRAGELQATTGEKVTLERLIEVSLRLLDMEAAARLILEERRKVEKGDAGPDPLQAAEPAVAH